MDRVPSIDLTTFRLGAECQPVIEAVRDACEQIGFLVISGHGIEDTLLAEAFAQSRAFFDQPSAEKHRAAPPIARRQRGYHEIASRNLGKTMGADVPPDLRESFFFGPIDDHRPHYADLPDAVESYAPNVLPDAPRGFTPTMIALYRGFERLSEDLLRIFALALDLPERWFADKTDRHFSVMSTHHYPPLTEPPRPGQLRTGAHTDFGAMTILAMTDGQGGLEVLLPNSNWSSVLAGTGELVVNLGDMMARWTNGRWASTVHRVVNPPVINLAKSRRQSIGYFMHPNDDTPIICIPTCRQPGAAPRFPDTTAGGHIRAKIAQSHKAA